MASAIPHYDPIESASWKQGEPVPYKALAELFANVEKISERNKMISLTCNFFRSIIATTPDDLLPSIYLICNKVAPTFEGKELGIGDSIIIKAIQDATGKSTANIKTAMKKTGDLGDVAATCKSTQRLLFPPPPLTVRGIFKDFRSLADMEGNKSQDRKMGVIKKLIVSAQGQEVKYIIRGLQGKLRIGLAEQSVIVALAQSVVLTPPSLVLPPPVLDASLCTNPSTLQERLNDAVELMKQVISECPSYDAVIPSLLSSPLSELHATCHLTPGVPVQPMLAKPTKGISEVLDRFQGHVFTCEYKYDGERAQIHKLPDGTIKIFSRNSEDNTSKYPDLIATLHQCIPEEVTTCILDSECVAWDREEGKILPFQVLSTRARKDVKEEDVKIHVVIFMFDLLYFNGESLIQKPLQERRRLLRSSIHEVEGRLQFATNMELDDTEQMQSFLQQSVASGCEGLMVKTLIDNATYEPSKRSLNWLKLKKDYLQDLGDSLDLVPIGGYYGKGKRTGAFGAFLLACYDVDSEEYQSVCKLGTGFSDEDLKIHSDFFNQHIQEKKPVYFNVSNDMQPDVWFSPMQVWEVRAADLSISPVHTGAIGLIDSEKGIALRFPRFIRIREDKKPEECTNSEQVADFYRSQSIVNLVEFTAESDSEGYTLQEDSASTHSNEVSHTDDDGMRPEDSGKREEDERVMEISVKSDGKGSEKRERSETSILKKKQKFAEMKKRRKERNEQSKINFSVETLSLMEQSAYFWSFVMVENQKTPYDEYGLEYDLNETHLVPYALPHTDSVLLSRIQSQYPDWKERFMASKMIKKGSPIVLIVCISAIRCTELLKSLSQLNLFIPKLFGKHIKIEEQKKALSRGTPIAIGVPNRILKLIEEGILDISSMNTLIIDMKENEKTMNVVSLRETREALIGMYMKYFHNGVIHNTMKVVFW